MKLADRIKDTTTTTGTGAFTLANSAPTGYRTLATGLGSGACRVRYVAELGSEWEVGEGTFNGTTGLTRDKVIASSNSNALVSFSTSGASIFVTASSMDLKAGSIGRTIGVNRTTHL